MVVGFHDELCVDCDTNQLKLIVPWRVLGLSVSLFFYMSCCATGWGSECGRVSERVRVRLRFAV